MYDYKMEPYCCTAKIIPSDVAIDENLARVFVQQLKGASLSHPTAFEPELILRLQHCTKMELATACHVLILTRNLAPKTLQQTSRFDVLVDERGWKVVLRLDIIAYYHLFMSFKENRNKVDQAEVYISKILARGPRFWIPKDQYYMDCREVMTTYLVNNQLQSLKNEVCEKFDVLFRYLHIPLENSDAGQNDQPIDAKLLADLFSGKDDDKRAAWLQELQNKDINLRSELCELDEQGWKAIQLPPFIASKLRTFASRMSVPHD